jgi:hypothetical protein
MISIAEFEKEYIKAIQNETAAVFAGAGIGIESGYVDWKSLLKDFAESINLDVERESDLVEVAQFYKNEKGNRYDINDTILNEFLNKSKNTKTVDALTSLPISCYWTTNYDHLLEDALIRQGKNTDVKITPESLSISLRNDAVTIYKMHGDCTDPSNCVLTKDDYEVYNMTRNLFSIALQGQLVTKTFLFIGFSFEDPNLKYILSRIRILLGENIRNHYCFLEKVSKQPKQKKKDFEYLRNKQELKIHDLQRYGIQAVMLDSYSQIPEILERIRLKAKTKNIFISGAAHTYGDKWDNLGTNLITLLAQFFYDNDYKIVTGHARGVGSYLISTVLENIQKNNSQLESHLLIRAFPYEDKANPNYENIKKNYRSNIAETTGISIFIFGNKLDDKGNIVLAEGMWDEYKIALEHNSYIIPIGSTGFVAEKIFKDVRENRQHFPYLSTNNFEILGYSNNPKEIVEYLLQ